MLQLTKEEPLWLGSPQDLANLRATFNQQFWIRLPQLLEPGLLRQILEDLAQSDFSPFIHPGIAKELVANRGFSFAILTFLFNDERLFRLIEQITGVETIQCFTGRIYRMSSGTDHYDNWHDDVSGYRLIALSLNLATQAHQGGVLQIRERGSKEVLQEVVNTTIGDAIIFKIDRGLQHRVTTVEGAASRTAFAGWFRSRPSFRELIFMNKTDEIEP